MENNNPFANSEGLVDGMVKKLELQLEDPSLTDKEKRISIEKRLKYFKKLSETYKSKKT